MNRQPQRPLHWIEDELHAHLNEQIEIAVRRPRYFVRFNEKGKFAIYTHIQTIDDPPSKVDPLD